MSLPTDWASIEDFATLYQYLWYRDFPIDKISIGAKRTDWTIHIGVVVRKIADLMGLVARFESGGRTDATLRSGDGDMIAVEWEWSGVWYEELGKLKDRKVWSKVKDSDRKLQYAVMISYTHPENYQKVIEHVKVQWKDAEWPLLLIIVVLDESKQYSFGKKFNEIKMLRFDKTEYKELRSAPAFPWEVEKTRWDPERENRP